MEAPPSSTNAPALIGSARIREIDGTDRREMANQFNYNARFRNNTLAISVTQRMHPVSLYVCVTARNITINWKSQTSAITDFINGKQVGILHNTAFLQGLDNQLTAGCQRCDFKTLVLNALERERIRSWEENELNCHINDQPHSILV